MGTESSAGRAGQKIDERYRLQALLKEEAASDLYSGVDETSRCKVWVRVLRDEYALQPKVVDHFAELPRQLMNQLGAGLPRVLAVGNDSSGVPYTVWEQLEGRDLEATLSDSGEALSFEGAMEWMAPVLRAVSRLHDLGKAHGELAPDSVLLAKTSAGTQPTLLHVGRPRDKTASTIYTAPELTRREPNAESDVYSLGMILFRMLSGRVPRRAETTSLREAAPDVPEELAALIDSCLADDPDARPPNALELLARAEKIQKRLRSDARREKARPATAPPFEPATGRRRAVPPNTSASAAAEKASEATPLNPLEHGNRPSPAPALRKPGPGPGLQEARAAVAARTAAVQEALEKAKKPAAVEAKPAAGAEGVEQAGQPSTRTLQPVSLVVYLELAAFTLFAWPLIRFTPALTSATLKGVEAALGSQFKAIGIAMAVAAVALVARLFMLQVKVFGRTLLPAALAMTGSALCIGIVVSAHLTSAELAGPLQAIARQGLAWFNGASFAMGALFMLRWGIAHIATRSALAAGSFAGAFLSVISSAGMVMHGLELLSRSP